MVLVTFEFASNARLRDHGCRDPIAGRRATSSSPGRRSVRCSPTELRSPRSSPGPPSPTFSARRIAATCREKTGPYLSLRRGLSTVSRELEGRSPSGEIDASHALLTCTGAPSTRSVSAGWMQASRRTITLMSRWPTCWHSETRPCPFRSETTLPEPTSQSLAALCSPVRH